MGDSHMYLIGSHKDLIELDLATYNLVGNKYPLRNVFIRNLRWREGGLMASFVLK